MINSPNGPLVSIVIPTYNHAHFLGSALQSVIDQTYCHWEAIVVDNHSDDDTVNVVKGFADPRIRFVQIHNQGVIAVSRNRGILDSRGELLAFLDSDDRWYPEKLKKCLERISEGYDLVCHGEKWIGNGRDRQVFYGPESRATYQSLLFDGNCISTSAVVMKIECALKAGGFLEDPQIVTAEDYDFWLRVAGAGCKIGFVGEILGEYTIHAMNQTRGVFRHMNAVLAVINRHLAQVAATGHGVLGWRARRRRAIAYYGGARGLQDEGQHREAWACFWKAITLWPFYSRIYPAMVFNALGKKILPKS